MPSLAEIRSLNQAGRAKDAEAGARVLLSILERGAPVDSLSLGETLDELSIALRRGGKAGQPESEQVGARAIAIKERSLGKRSAGYAASLYNMGMLWYARDDASRAISILQETLEIRVAALGSEHRDVALTLLAIGAVHSQMGKDVAAEEAIDRAVSIQKATLEADDPD
ncbi:MAG TPA: tetratricopeptide repeat protein, partial [Candidatus Eisenbacteria bacterium]|nr:tetratricopeptide repeat protein [Candidatus Eisenbacteria bacterium]